MGRSRGIYCFVSQIYTSGFGSRRLCFSNDKQFFVLPESLLTEEIFVYLICMKVEVEKS